MSRRSSTGSSGGGRPSLLHLEPFSGIAGDMLLGALLDLGLPRRELESGLAGLALDFKLRVGRVRRGALAAKHVDVMVKKKAGKGRKPAGHAHGAGPASSQGHAALQGHTHGRSYAAICKLLTRAKLDPEVRDGALATFEALGRAEARVHGVKLDEVHFHEVGAVDAIVDITGAAVGLKALGVKRVTCSPVALGHGSVETAHGRLPLPAPATLELLVGIPTVPAHVAWETVTPTGAALLRTWVDEYRELPEMIPAKIGYGAGGDRKGPMPNVIRGVLGHAGGPGWDRIVSLETNLDDLIPEHFDHVMERLFDAGALDVSLSHLQMKKNRPGFLLRVLARPAQRRELAELLFAESTAIGVRTQEWDRLLLERELRKVDTPFGRIGVKLLARGDGRVEVSAEYDDCKRASRSRDVPLRDVVRAAEERGREEFSP
jgi:uncharacterized protein (TIGR00299 family) protein